MLSFLFQTGFTDTGHMNTQKKYKTLSFFSCSGALFIKFTTFYIVSATYPTCQNNKEPSDPPLAKSPS